MFNYLIRILIILNFVNNEINAFILCNECYNHLYWAIYGGKQNCKHHRHYMLQKSIDESQKELVPFQIYRESKTLFTINYLFLERILILCIIGLHDK